MIHVIHGLWHELDGSGVTVAVAGGKAASLDRLIASGADVPAAAILTTGAYRLVVAAGRMAPFLRSLPRRVAPNEIDGDVARVEEAFRRAPMPEIVRDAIRGAVEAVADGGPVAVRSSATVEDLAASSFAGQYVSVLDVGHDKIEMAVRRCWASLWFPGARTYRRARRVDEAGIGMGIIIQRMVEPSHAGVLFTVDPTSGDPIMRIECVEGKGEQLVSGAVTPQVFRVDRDGGSIAPEGAPPFVDDLVAAARAIERDAGEPQDIEWCVEGDVVRILQARPVTTVVDADPFDSHPAPGVLFTPVGLGEMLPGVLPPLIWTIDAPMVEGAFAGLFARLGIEDDPGGAPMLARFRGRAALNLTRLSAAARKMPGGSAAEIESQYLQEVVSEDARARPTLGQRVRRLGPGLRSLRLRRALLGESDAFLRAVDLAVALPVSVGSLSSDALVAYRRAIRDLARFGIATEVAVSAAAAASYRGLDHALRGALGEEGASQAAQRVTAGRIGEYVSGFDAVRSVWNAHGGAFRTSTVVRALEGGPADRTEQRLRALGTEGAAFLRLVEGTLARSSSTAVYGGPTWDEERDAFWSLLRRCYGDVAGARSGAGSPGRDDVDRGALEDLGGAIRSTWRWRARRILTGQIVDLRWRLIRRMVSDASRFLRLREAVKAAVLRLGGEERRVIREGARRMLDGGAIGSPGDELLLTDAEFDALLRGGAGPDPASLAVRRRVTDRARAMPPLAHVFEGAPSPDDGDGISAEDGVLRGWATSPGRATGRARVVAALEDAAELEPGEILVGHSMDPSWTALFLTAAGVVMEEGGPLSHAAIVARECGIPAVLNVRAATRRIRTGMMITVDGARGTIEGVTPDGTQRAGRVA